MDNVVTAEKAIHGSQITIVETVGYAAGSDVPVATKTYTTAGTLTTTVGTKTGPGEVAALLRWSTNARSTKNHPIYLFNYYHGVALIDTSGNSDVLEGNTKTAMGTYATSWISGFSDGTITAVRAGPNGDAATGQTVEEYVTHRDFPYSRSL